MNKHSFSILVMLLMPLCIFAQTTIKGIVKDNATGSPIPGVKVTLLQQDLATQTNESGEFTLSYVEAGDEEIRFTHSNYFATIKAVLLQEGKVLDIGDVLLRYDALAETKQDIVLQLSESQLEDEAGSQMMAGSFSSKNDVYLAQTSYSFSPMRFRTRGYDQKYESTYINGVRFVDAERGGFNYSSLGGLNNATRNKDLVYGLSPNSFSYGNLGANTNINTTASSFATGTNVNLALSNRAYKIRGQVLHATGVMPNGWALAASAVVRYAGEGAMGGIVDGTFYNSVGYFLSAEKIFGDHRISIVTFGAPTRRAQQAAITAEARELAGSIYYNPYWGYQDGKERNSRIVNSFDPTAIISHAWKIDEKQKLTTGLGVHYSMYSNSTFAYNGSHPAPDYYRYMPSFAYSTGGSGDWLTELWQNDEYTRQVKWDELYRANQYNNSAYPNGQAAFILLRRHNNLIEGTLNSLYQNNFTDNLKFTSGVEARLSKGKHYQTVDDLLGANQLLDFDTYADRDMTGDNSGWSVTPDSRYIQNDLRNPNRAVKTGEIWGYNYDINVLTSNAFAQFEASWQKVDAYIAGKVTYTGFNRYGYMENGRAWYLRYLYETPTHPDHSKGQNVNSLGQSKTWWFVDPSVKAGLTYNINGNNRIIINGLAETRAPLIQDVYVSERIKDQLSPNLKPEKILSFDLNYAFNFKAIRGRIGAFHTTVNDAVDKYGYYDDANRTFVNHLLSGYNKLYQGIEAGVSIPLNTMFTLSAAGTYGDYRFTSDAIGVKSPENGSFVEVTEVVKTKDLKINNGPQFAANITLDFFYKMWFADVTLNYFDNNYLDFAPNRFTENNQKLMADASTPDILQKLGTQEKLKGGFLLDASLGRMIYLKNRNSLNINISVNNILNNTDLITGGYQQARIPTNTDKTLNEKGVNWYPNKYYYAWGFNFFVHVGYKFSGAKKEKEVVTSDYNELQPKQVVVTEQKTEGDPIQKQKELVEKVVEKPKAEVVATKEPQKAAPVDTVPPTCVFETNKYEVNNSLKPILDSITKELKSDKNLVVIIKGHTDSTGSEAYNQTLSEKRANAVKKYLVTKNVESDRITTIGFGETKPIADNNTKSGRAKNRRVEIIVK